MLLLPVLEKFGGCHANNQQHIFPSHLPRIRRFLSISDNQSSFSQEDSLKNTISKHTNQTHNQTKMTTQQPLSDRTNTASNPGAISHEKIDDLKSAPANLNSLEYHRQVLQGKVEDGDK